MLDKSIIDEFVKTTARRNTNVQPPKVTMIGTVVVSGGKNYVTIDGSTELTPVTTTTKLNDGDRVTINISDNTQCDSLYQTILYIPDISRLTLPVNTAELTFELVKSENQRQGYLIIKPLTQNVHELNLSYN